MNRVNSPVIWFNRSERYYILLLFLWHTCAVCLNCIKHFDRMNCESSPLQSHPTEMFKLKKQAVQNFHKINHAGTLGLSWDQPYWRRSSSSPAANLPKSSQTNQQCPDSRWADYCVEVYYTHGPSATAHAHSRWHSDTLLSRHAVDTYAIQQHKLSGMMSTDAEEPLRL